MMCMQHVPTIAIVGRPNVGKSAIFNRMAGRRIAIVHDEPGVTRDRLSAPCKITDRACKIMDTGGIGARLGDGFAEQVEAEADIAIKNGGSHPLRAGLPGSPYPYRPEHRGPPP